MANFYYYNYFFRKKSNNCEGFSCNLKKVIVQVSFKDFFFKESGYLSFLLFFLEFLTFQKANFGFSKKDVSFWRLRKNDNVSLYLTLNQKSISFFIEKLNLFYLSKMVPQGLNFFFIKRNYILCSLPNIFILNELEYENLRVQASKIPLLNFKINLIFIFDTSEPLAKKNCLRSFKIPIRI